MSNFPLDIGESIRIGLFQVVSSFPVIDRFGSMPGPLEHCTTDADVICCSKRHPRNPLRCFSMTSAIIFALWGFTSLHYSPPSMAALRLRNPTSTGSPLFLYTPLPWNLLCHKFTQFPTPWPLGLHLIHLDETPRCILVVLPCLLAPVMLSCIVPRMPLFTS